MYTKLWIRREGKLLTLQNLMKVNGINNFRFTLADNSATDVKQFKIFSLLINIHLKKTKTVKRKLRHAVNLCLVAHKKFTCHRWETIIFKP